MAAEDHPPIPDPTILTTEALHREIWALRVLLQAQLGGLEEQLNRRFESEEKLSVTRLESVETKFALIERSITAGLLAAKELSALQESAGQKAIDKSEVAVAKTIESQGISLQASVNSNSSKIEDLKERVSRMENRAQGATDIRSEQRQSLTMAQGMLAAAAGVIAVIIGFFALHHTNATPGATVTVTVPTVITTQSPTVTVTTKSP